MNDPKTSRKAGRNRTLTVSDEERAGLESRIVPGSEIAGRDAAFLRDRTVCADLMEVIDLLPKRVADLIVVDPPYNLDKNFHGVKFSALSDGEYLGFLRSWFPKVVELLKGDGSLYMCGDWKCTSALQAVMEESGLTVLNRITWQREKGRGASKNWKNGMEDIWFGVRNRDDYYFDVGSVMVRRRVIAPYKEEGRPKDWEETAAGNFRTTHPSNFWDDISVPYWSMPENTDHPTQKPEKLITKLILASCPPGGLVFDPFLGSGTTSVVAKKLGRHYLGVEANREYCVWAEKRLALADRDKSIQGYVDGVFWERNTYNMQKEAIKKASAKEADIVTRPEEGQ